MALTAMASTVISYKVQAIDNREGRIRTRGTERGRRGLLLSTATTAIAVIQVNDSRTELLKKYLKKSEESKTKNDKERLESYYKRNYRDYFGLLEGSLRQKKEQLSESEKGILEWLDKNN
ncbi:unnamed protein product [Ilex paraguariensis]|uniref:Uncharacterized protein n=1 Tax=Ilex paraguariensis TaxID=185542 RepID=A0ABC8ST81_9AQUA